MVNKKITKNKLLLFMTIIFETLIIKVLQYKILPGKYFYDAEKIMLIMNGSKITDKGFSFTANLFNTINIFNITSLQGWSICISVIFTLILLIVLNKKNDYTLSQSFFVVASIALLNIYVFNLSKDIIQFVFFLIIYWIIFNDKIKNKHKILLSNIVLLFIALYFRTYFGIVLLLADTIYFSYYFFVKSSQEKKKQIKIIMLIITLFFIEVFIVGQISTENYNLIINARHSINIYRENSTDANTMINDILGQNSNFLIFIGNYIINFARMLVPIELLIKGFKYIPFIIYQLFITYNILKILRKINNKNIVMISMIIGFLMVSIIYEPDFGSFIRHESALVLIILNMCIENSKNKEEKNRNERDEKSISYYSYI